MPDDPEKTSTPDSTPPTPVPRPFSLVAKYAVALTLLPLALLVLAYPLSFVMYEDSLVFCAFVLAVIAPFVSVAAVIHIMKSGSRGMAAAIVCLVVSLGYIIVPIILVPQMRQLYSQMECGSRMEDIGYGIVYYQENLGGSFPDPNKWCDLLVEHACVSRKALSLDAYKEGISFVALNPNATPDSPPDTVLAFECRPGWNQHGGPELINPNRHNGAGCTILFKDLHVEFVKGEKYQKSLRWSADPNLLPTTRHP